MKSKIIHRRPWFFPILKWFFPSADFETTVFVLGRKIYSKYPMTQELFVHEYTHCEQQNLSTIKGILWWIKYIADPRFRLCQETHAYQNQYLVFISLNKDRNKQAKYLQKIAADLSGELYVKAIDVEGAKYSIRENHCVCGESKPEKVFYDSVSRLDTKIVE